MRSRGLNFRDPDWGGGFVRLARGVSWSRTNRQTRASLPIPEEPLPIGV